MKYTLTIKVPVYNFVCEVVFADKVEPLINKLRKKQNLQPIEGLVHGYALGTNTAHKYHLFYDLESTDVNTLAHEISHLVDFVFADREIDPPTGEPRAYLTGHISEEIFEYTFKKRIIKSKWLQNQQLESPLVKETKKAQTNVQNPLSDLQTNNN